MGKIVLITGITGQDGSYLAESALSRGHTVHGVLRRSSSFNTDRIDHLMNNPKVHLHYGDLGDGTNISKLIRQVKPDYCFNMAAQSHVQVSFEVPEYSANVDGLGVLRVLDAIKTYAPKCRFLQASTSEMFGKVRETPQNELTPFYPRSPYGAAKVFGYYITVNYREAYGLFAANAITFNHESERRLQTFVTRKITTAAVNIKNGNQEVLTLGNLAAKRDWSYAPDIIDGMWRIIDYDTPDDFVLASEETHSVEEFCLLAFQLAGIDLVFNGDGVNRKGIDRKGIVRVTVNPKYFRPTEVDLLLGDATKAKTVLGWAPEKKFTDLVTLMVDHDMRKTSWQK